MPKSTTSLVRYDQARHALAQCERIDEAKNWSDKAAALAAYARQADDPELEATARRIRARAFRRMGEISRELEKAHKVGRGTKVQLPSTGKLKATILAEAGISTSQAHRAEKVAAIPVEEFEQRVESDTPPPISVLLTSRKAPRAAAHDGNDEWYTPAGVVVAARAVMGRIDLDPASTSGANETVQATAIYTVEDDGLTQPWRGCVFLNPPFSAQLKRAFCDRLRESVASGDVTQAVLVTPIDISPQWGDVIRKCASAVALAVGSTPFYGPRGERGGPGFGHMVSYYGPHVGRFASVFGKEWSVWVRPTEH